ncbi:MAG: hypothetical protein IT427_08620 [Pirellulales bacterium]|nr:hypothetical protein [Pirellulales bacterium]
MAKKQAIPASSKAAGNPHIKDFTSFNTVYWEFFAQPFPAWATVQSVLGAGISIEIDAVAIRRCGQNNGEDS